MTVGGIGAEERLICEGAETYSLLKPSSVSLFCMAMFSVKYWWIKKVVCSVGIMHWSIAVLAWRGDTTR